LIVRSGYPPPREGIAYDDLPDEEQAEWDEIEWDEDDGKMPKRVEASAVNKWLFNKDTVDKVLEHLMTRGQKVAGGDRLGKTIIFAAGKKHAEFICERFDANYQRHKGAFARVIHNGVTYSQSLIDDFSVADKAPHIMVSVDMLDTGIDVPEVLNLVFFKLVRSKTKFWQMVGRGTRLCPGVFGPGKDKEFFFILDYCQNLEFFKQDPKTSEGSLADSLGKRLFKTRLELVGEMDRPALEAPPPAQGTPDAPGHAPAAAEALREDVVSLLHREVAAMNVDNFVVRPKRRLIEKYSAPEAWVVLTDEARSELGHEVAGLPSELPSEDEEAKRFDLLILNLQLAVLRVEPSFERLRDQVKSIAAALEEKASIPMVQQHLALIQDLQSDGIRCTSPVLPFPARRAHISCP
jgi:type I restriction enzyme R subunit